MDESPSRESRWLLTQDTFERFLASLDGDRERAGEKYEIARRKLVKFFAWHGSHAPEEHADETINRVARKISEGEKIESLNAYLLGVARLLLKEVFKQRLRARAALDQLPTSETTEPGAEEEDDNARRTLRECLRACLQKLAPESRALIADYYEHDRASRIRRRKEIAAGLGIPLNALRIRAHRVRAGLEACVRACAGRAGMP
ncbi:MAG: RNA polymerase sigma factor [Pyrinomonadaceae bacterium]